MVEGCIFDQSHQNFLQIKLEQFYSLKWKTNFLPFLNASGEMTIYGHSNLSPIMVLGTVLLRMIQHYLQEMVCGN